MRLNQQIAKHTEKVISGNIQAYEMLVCFYYQTLFEYAVCYVRSPQHAKSIVHQAFLSVWQQRESIDKDSIDPFLFSTLSGLIVEHLERASVDSLLQEEMWNCILRYQRHPQRNTSNKNRENISRTIQNTKLQIQLSPGLKVP